MLSGTRPEKTRPIKCLTRPDPNPKPSGSGRVFTWFGDPTGHPNAYSRGTEITKRGRRFLVLKKNLGNCCSITPPFSSTIWISKSWKSAKNHQKRPKSIKICDSLGKLPDRLSLITAKLNAKSAFHNFEIQIVKEKCGVMLQQLPS